MFVSWDTRQGYLLPCACSFSITSDSFASPFYLKRRKVESLDSSTFSQVLPSKLSLVLHRLEVIATMGLSDFSCCLTSVFTSGYLSFRAHIRALYDHPDRTARDFPRLSSLPLCYHPDSKHNIRPARYDFPISLHE